MWNALLAETAHRPWPLPEERFAMTMTWESLLFAHWPLPPSRLAPLIPAGLELDLFDGQAWIAVVPFAMRNVGPRFSNRLPWISRFLELNVRTYVTAAGKPGVFFLSLDAANPVAVEVARRRFRQPYFNARMRLREDGNWTVYESERTDRRLGPGRFAARYWAVGPVYRSSPGDLDHWLTERYALYAVDRGGGILRGDVHHRPWPLQVAEAEFQHNTVTDAHGIELPPEPQFLHFVQSLDVVAWNPVNIH
jgi:uncharacterized protein